MTRFEGLTFHPLPHGKQAKVFYDNGYGASIVQHSFSYGNEHGLYELAVIQGNQVDWSICYDTHITDNVLGHLTEDDVSETLLKISQL